MIEKCMYLIFITQVDALRPSCFKDAFDQNDCGLPPFLAVAFPKAIAWSSELEHMDAEACEFHTVIR